MNARPCECVTSCGDCKETGDICQLSKHPSKPAGFTLPHQRAGRIYVAGPMSGLPDLNVPAFNAAATQLRAQGWHVENPADHGVIEGAEWADYLHYDLTRLATCGAILLLPGWEKSKGATLELHIAKALGMEVVGPGLRSPPPSAQTAPQHKGEWTREVVQGFLVIHHPGGDSYEFPLSMLAGHFTTAAPQAAASTTDVAS